MMIKTLKQAQELMEETFYFINQINPLKRTQEELNTLEELIDNNMEDLKKFDKRKNFAYWIK